MHESRRIEPEINLTEKRFEMPIQVDRDHYFGNYDDAKRWSSYWMQIDMALRSGAEHILEVGLGNGLVAAYLQEVHARRVTTADHDPALLPTIVADIRSLPFCSDAFELSMACEVLEHIPFPEIAAALRELRRVSRICIISVPDTSFQLSFELGVRNRSAYVALPLPRVRQPSHLRVPNEHHWEIGMPEYPLSRIADAIAASGWEVASTTRNPHNTFHRLFELR